MPLRVLLAADSQLLQRSVRELLESAGLTLLDAACDHDRALHLAATHYPDVMIVDCDTPDLNAIELARAVRRTLSNLPVILLSTIPSERQITAAFAAGILGYVVKADAAFHLLRAITDVTCGTTFVSPSASRVVCDAYLLRPPRQR
jgi:DNA-binding NarL/FixJ family response regulator